MIESEGNADGLRNPLIVLSLLCATKRDINLIQTHNSFFQNYFSPLLLQHWGDVFGTGSPTQFPKKIGIQGVLTFPPSPWDAHSGSVSLECGQ